MEICSVFLAKNFQLQFVLEVSEDLFSKDKGKNGSNTCGCEYIFFSIHQIPNIVWLFSISNRGGATPPPAGTQGRACAPLSVTALPTCTKMYYNLFPLTMHVLVSALGYVLKMY